MTNYRTLVGADATTEDVDTFVMLAGSGGADGAEYVRIGVVRPGAKIIFAEVGGEAAGVAALKVPTVGYRSGLQSTVKADYALPTSEYPYELGYVSVLPKHSRLGWKTPTAFAQTFTPQRGLTLRNPQSSAPAPVAQPAQTGKTQTRSLAHAG